MSSSSSALVFIKKLNNIAKIMGVEFSFRGKAITYNEVFSETGLLPAIAKRADQLCSLCLGYGLGVTFEETKGSVLGVKAVFDDSTPIILRLFCITDILFELSKNATSKKSIPLDELVYE